MKGQKQNSKELIYGKHSVLSALNNEQRQIFKFYTTDKAAFDKYSKKFPSALVNNNELNKLLPEGAVHAGFALSCSRKPTLSAHEFVNLYKDEQRVIIAALDQVTDPHNIGAIIRSAVAFNVKAIIITDHNSNHDSPIIAKSASGTLEDIEIILETNLAQTLDFLKKHNYWCIGLDGEAKKEIKDLPDFEKKVIVLGAEGKGLRRLTKDYCDEIIKIKMNNNVESLNVSNAAAITFYEFNK